MRILAVCLAILLAVGPAWGAPGQPKKKAAPALLFIRVKRDKAKHPLSLDTAITRVVSDEGWTVDLIGAVHLGEKSYYQQLNKEFKGYQAVLYELIAESEPGHKPVPVPGENGDNPLSAMQTGLCKLLGLQFQLDHIDYRPANLVHADISPQQFSKSMEKNRESLAQVLMRVLQMDQQDNPEDEELLDQLDLMGILTKGPSPKDRRILRVVLANAFQNLDQLNKVLNGPGGSTLLHVRNDHCLQVLRQQRKAGQRHFAIFYGAAHMPDMLAKLRKDPHVRLQGQRWLAAWNLQEASAGIAPR